MALLLVKLKLVGGLKTSVFCGVRGEIVSTCRIYELLANRRWMPAMSSYDPCQAGSTGPGKTASGSGALFSALSGGGQRPARRGCAGRLLAQRRFFCLLDRKPTTAGRRKVLKKVCAAQDAGRPVTRRTHWSLAHRFLSRIRGGTDVVMDVVGDGRRQTTKDLPGAWRPSMPDLYRSAIPRTAKPLPTGNLQRCGV